MRVLLRQTRANRYTLPLLMNLVEQWDQKGILELDVARSPQELIRHLGSSEGTFVGYSFMTPHLEDVMEELKTIGPYLGARDIVVAGGPHASADPEGTLELGFHAVVAGEAEDLMSELLGAWINAKDSRELHGIWKPTRTCSLEKALPVSRRASFMAPLEITRGCPHGCTYCFTPRFHSRTLRHRSLESVRDYLLASVEMGRHTARFIAPDAFSYRAPGLGDEISSLRSLLGLCQKMGIKHVHLGDFPSEVRPDRVKPELLELLLLYCKNRKLVIGAQSGSNRVLRLVKRGHTVEQVFEAVRQVVGFGLMAHVDMLFGLPGETSQDRIASLRLMERLISMGRVRIHAHMYLPLPGTPLFGLEPPEVEPWFMEELSRMQAHGALDGDWETQALLQKKILGWLEKGLIRKA
ncbi:MAG: TIGR04013 family B12-binding domain/radical SAM domain-containing protein [bacterium]